MRDFDDLRRWARQQEEPISEFMEMRFIKGSSKDPRGIHMLLERAKQAALDTGKAVDECLPPGLEMSVVDVCTVRQVSQEKADNVRARMRAVMEEADV